MRRRNCLPLLVILMSVLACEADSSNLVLTVSGAAPPLGYQLGDTVQFLAEQEFRNAQGYTTRGQSSTDPRYTWTSTAPEVIRMIAPGRFEMLKVGEAYVTVETAYNRRTARILVLPRVRSLRATPRQATAIVGDSILIDVDPLDSTGAVIPVIKGTLDVILAANTLDAAGHYSVVALVPSRLPPFTLRAIGVGTGRIIVRLDVHRVPTPRDTVMIEVNAAAPPSVRAQRQ